MRALFKFYIVLFSVLSLTFSGRAFDNSFFSRFRDRKSPSFNREELRPLGQWKFSPMVTRDATIVIGVNLDKQQAFKVVDAGIDHICNIFHYTRNGGKFMGHTLYLDGSDGKSLQR